MELLQMLELHAKQLNKRNFERETVFSSFHTQTINDITGFPILPAGYWKLM